jgi:arsenate reductase-like glutaredoxin family protein
MTPQIFGTRKNPNVRAALRFFAERRINVHFVDLEERAASFGELRRFAQKFGVKSLIDPESKRYAALGLKASGYSEERWLDLLTREPLLLRTPLVREGNRLTIGPAVEEWVSWLADRAVSLKPKA